MAPEYGVHPLMEVGLFGVAETNIPKRGTAGVNWPPMLSAPCHRQRDPNPIPLLIRHWDQTIGSRQGAMIRKSPPEGAMTCRKYSNIDVHDIAKQRDVAL